MEYRTFGRTGLRVSIAGIGCGGASRLGLGTGSTEEQAIGIVRRGIELGLNYIDTAEGYQTEDVVGRAVEGLRESVVISSKVVARHSDRALNDAAGLRSSLEASLVKLRTDVVDVFHLHRVAPNDYDYAMNELYPELVAQRDRGKIRFIGISESSSSDEAHSMLRRAVEDGCWDVVMTSFNLFNQSARDDLFPAAIKNDVAVEIMASARSEFSRPELLAAEIVRLVEAGEIERGLVDLDDPLGFLAGSGVDALTEVSYRFAAHEPGVHVVLVGTGNPAHLEENVRALSAGPLPGELHNRLVQLFGHLLLAVQVPEGHHRSRRGAVRHLGVEQAYDGGVLGEGGAR